MYDYDHDHFSPSPPNKVSVLSPSCLSCARQEEDEEQPFGDSMDAQTSPFHSPKRSNVGPKILRIRPETTLEQLLQDDAVTTHTNLDAFEQKVAQETWNWCTRFVVTYRLCPWAAASVSSENAVQIFLVVMEGERPDEDGMTYTNFERGLYLASQTFQQQLKLMQSKGFPNYTNPNTAIGFVVQVSQCDDWDFHSFYDWYLLAEDKLFDGGLASDQAADDPALRPCSEQITWAPFHPNWRYCSDEEADFDDNNSLGIEKQTPYPTVSIVSSEAIDEAGPLTTEQIISNNQRLLSTKPVSVWEQIYKQAVRVQPADKKNA